MDDKAYVSVLVPVLNEEESLPELHKRLQDTLNGIGKPYEIIYINDGSTDTTEVLLERFHADDKRIKVIEFNRNYGQHMALFSGFEFAKGEIVITIDADLQNPPEEIPKLVDKAEEGFEVVATYRKQRKDSLFRKTAVVYREQDHGKTRRRQAPGLWVYAPGVSKEHYRLHEYVS